MREDLPDLPAGIWRHYKGPLYQVFGYAHDANAEDFYGAAAAVLGTRLRPLEPLGERFVVVYMALQLDGAHTGPRIAVRTASDFHADVCANRPCPLWGLPFDALPDGGCVRCGEMPGKRFAYVGTVWEGDGG